MRILVTGGSGGIGGHLVPELLKRGHQICVFDRRSVELPNDVGLIIGDLRNPEDVFKAVENADAVIHLAAILPPVSEENPDASAGVNINGTKNIIAAMQASRFCKRLIFTSTTAVHGSNPHRNFPIGVDEPLDPPDHYAKQKIAAENLIRDSDLNWTILRIPATPPIKISKGPKGGLKLFLKIPPDSRIEILHPDDAATAFSNCVENLETIGKTLFLGGGKKNGCQITGYEMSCGMSRAFGIGELPRHIFNTDPGGAHAEWLDTRESQALLRYQTHTFQDLVGDIRKNIGFAYYVSRLVSPITRFIIINFVSYR